MPKPDTALTYGMRPLKDVYRQSVLTVTALGATLPLMNTGDFAACHVQIKPHAAQVFYRVNGLATTQNGAVCGTDGVDHVFLLGPRSASREINYIHFLAEPTQTSISVNYGIIAP
jgi:hypothetical protein